MKTIILILILLFYIGCGGSSNPSSIVNDVDDKNQSSSIAKEINMPVCDASNSKVQFIHTEADWGKINDISKSIFCVKPGNYQNRLVIIKNINGTKDNPRYIVLDNGNDEHPAKLNISQLANVDLEFDNASYWIIDRMSSIGSQGLFDAPVLFRSSSNNIVNRHFVSGSSGGIILRNKSHNNTIQYSRLQNMSEVGIKGDRVCIELAPMESIGEIMNTKILYNEIHNCNDGFQAVARNNTEMNYEGTFVYGNDISVDSSLYSDCNGHKDMNGLCSYSENAIDIKAGSKNPNNKFIIKKNRMWGFRKSERTETKLSDHGAAFAMHYDSKNIIANDNIIFDSARGILVASVLNDSYALEDSQISGNFITNISEFPLVVNEAFNIIVSNNTIINISNKSWLVLDQSQNISVVDNKIVDNVFDINYGTSSNIDEKNNLFYHTITEVNLVDMSFITNKYSNNPIKIDPVK